MTAHPPHAVASPRTRSRTRLLALAAVLLGVAAAVVGAWSTGAMAALVFVADAGPLVRWGALVVRVVHDLAAATTVGAFLLAGTVLPDPAQARRAARLGTGAAVAWTVAALVGTVLGFADAVGLPLTSADLPGQFAAYALTIDTTLVGLASTVVALAVALLGAFTRPRRATWVLTSGLAALGIVIVGLGGHTGTSDQHQTAVDALGLHLLGATVWVGGLAALLLVGPGAAAVRRYSSLALVAYLGVAVSGVLTATTRLGTWGDLLTPYGRLILVKTGALLILGAAGWAHRRRSIADLEGGQPTGFRRLAVGEVLVMAATFGIATALARSAPPEPENIPDPTPALKLTGLPAPGAPRVSDLATTWRVDWLWLFVVLAAIGLYAAGLAARRHRASSGWPARRTWSWAAGWLVLLWCTSGLPGIAARVSYSWNLAVDLGLALVVAPLLVAGRPLGLAASVLRPRDDDTLGPRELLFALRESRAVRWLTGSGWAPPTAAGAVLVSVVLVVHLTSVLVLTVTTHPGHVLGRVAHLAAGIVLGVATTSRTAPAHERPVSGIRDGFVLIGVGMLLGALGAVILLSRHVLAPEVFTQLQLPWVPDPLVDQRRGGLVALAGAAWLALSGVGRLVVAGRASEGQVRPAVDQRVAGGPGQP